MVCIVVDDQREEPKISPLIDDMADGDVEEDAESKSGMRLRRNAVGMAA
jgi:hypothetical protein